MKYQVEKKKNTDGMEEKWAMLKYRSLVTSAPIAIHAMNIRPGQSNLDEHCEKKSSDFWNKYRHLDQIDRILEFWLEVLQSQYQREPNTTLPLREEIWARFIRRLTMGPHSSPEILAALVEVTTEVLHGRFDCFKKSTTRISLHGTEFD